MKCYPVIIPTLNRYKHLKECIESLAKCAYADHTDLIIGLDFPPNEKYQEGYRQIRSYIPTIKGFKSIIVLEHSRNLGPLQNVISLIEYVKDNLNYDAFVCTEDDNIFAPSFLEFMNTSLDYYKEDSNISTICGYLSDNQCLKKKGMLLNPDSCAWGTGYWFDKSKVLNRIDSHAILFSFLKSWKIYIAYPACLNMLMAMYNNHHYYGDVVRTSLNILNKTYQLRPTVSLVRNMGYDGSGVNCSVDDSGYSTQRLYDGESYIIDKNTPLFKYSRQKLFFYNSGKKSFRTIIHVIFIWLRYVKFRMQHINHS